MKDIEYKVGDIVVAWGGVITKLLMENNNGYPAKEFITSYEYNGVLQYLEECDIERYATKKESEKLEFESKLEMRKSEDRLMYIHRLLNEFDKTDLNKPYTTIFLSEGNDISELEGYCKNAKGKILFGFIGYDELINELIKIHKRKYEKKNCNF